MLALFACTTLPLAASMPAYAQSTPATPPLPERAPGEDAPAASTAPAENAAPDTGNAGEAAPPSGIESVPLPEGPDDDTSMVRENHGAWSMVCDQPPGANGDQCALMQNVIADDRPEIGLSIAVLKTADRQSKLLRILAPLGVFLPEGMGLFVDGVNIGKAYYSRCYFDGCYVEVDIDDDLMKIFRAGKEAVFTLNFSVDQNTIGIPVDLDGLGEGYDALP
ncbi:invasion associated locus B family protein [Martelella endophytica]|uniref:Invasion associated locus B family protein n=1 Tax=Martelella endophytica TaxID=1486262 RepID=A0A0D5LV25_MAREN|nr:invasion associated locus B family protein [Martelella endophytica]